jgi:prephenate dehydratase
MSEPRLIVFKGKNSQTGQAFVMEFPDAPFAEANESFTEIRDIIRDGSCLSALPIWNSHQGEIADAKVIAMLLEDKARICRLWPKEIIFCCVSRVQISERDITTVISIGVARTQCSRFLDELNISKDCFTPAGSTTEAYSEFDRNSLHDVVLCAPGSHSAKYFIFRKNAANPLNFTAFVLLGSSDCNTWLGQDQWTALQPYLGAVAVYAGVEMPIPDGSEDTEELFDALVSKATTVDTLPKVVFAARRSGTRCAIIVEAGDYPLSGSLIREGGEIPDIVIHTDLGRSGAAYTPRAQELVLGMIERDYPLHLDADFVCHLGKETCFFACPALGMLTHGFERRVVERVFREYVVKCFSLIDNEAISCSEVQLRFFAKYKQAYYDQDVEFIKFVELGI